MALFTSMVQRMRTEPQTNVRRY